jgi:tetratricopeptide (TPR) repeat protein
MVLGQLGYVYYVMRRYDDAINQFQKALDLYPNAAMFHAPMAAVYALKDMYPQALAESDKIAERDRAVTEENQAVAGVLGWVYAVSGRRDDALKLAKGFKTLSAQAYVDFYPLAAIYAGLGENDKAFQWLEKACAEHSSGMPSLATDPWWYEMRSDPRYADLLRRVGLPQPN